MKLQRLQMIHFTGITSITKSYGRLLKATILLNHLKLDRFSKRTIQIVQSSSILHAHWKVKRYVSKQRML